MTDVMSQLRLSSGMPFGLLIILVFLMSVCTLATVAAVRLRSTGWR